MELVNHLGETSFYLLALEEGICLTSDNRAYQKFMKENLKAMRIRSFYFEKFNVIWEILFFNTFFYQKSSKMRISSQWWVKCNIRETF